MAYPAVVLAILDGFGSAPAWGGNAITNARSPTFDALAKEPHALLAAAGEAVGLQPGAPGNSEVGHLNLGSGRVVLQESVRISTALADQTFFDNPVLGKAFRQIKETERTLHLMGLLSPVGIHAVYDHLLGLIKLAQQKGLTRVKLHIFTDGRDSPVREALALIIKLEADLARLAIGQIQTVSGRYYAMDRDNHWDRTKQTFDAIAYGQGRRAVSPRQALTQSYAQDLTDEFVEPTVVAVAGSPAYAGLAEGDAVVFFNCRADRARQLTRLFTDSQMSPSLRPRPLPPHTFITLVPYSLSNPLSPDQVAFSPPALDRILAQVVSEAGERQFHISETEKWAHVTYFFNGRHDTPFPGEERVLVPSPPVATYDLAPAMAADQITDRLISQLGRTKETLYVTNYANADMVGHTGNFRAAIAAVETLDRQVRRLAEACVEKGIPLIITADHGNVEQMVDPQTGEIDTEHTHNPVPCYFVLPEPLPLPRRTALLADVAPTVLFLLGRAIPVEMTGSSLLGQAI